MTHEVKVWKFVIVALEGHVGVDLRCIQVRVLKVSRCSGEEDKEAFMYSLGYAEALLPEPDFIFIKHVKGLRAS
jgi:hypothetical protein